MKKHSYEFIKEYIEKENYILLSKKYINSRTKLKIRCDKGHEYEVIFNAFHNGSRCPVCSMKKKYTYKEVKLYIESFNYILLSEKYINCKTKLEIMCEKGHIYDIKFESFKNSGQRCPVCAGVKKHNYEYVKSYIESFGNDIISKEYINNKYKLKVKCEKGHIYDIRFDSFKNGRRCPECKKNLITSKGEKEVLEYIKTIYSGKIIENDRNQILNPLTNHFLELDIYLPEIKLAIEYNGDYWHNSPKRKLYDKIKIDVCRELGINILIIKENEWKDNYNLMKLKIKNFIF